MKKITLTFFAVITSAMMFAQTNLTLDTWTAKDNALNWSAQLNALSFIVGDTSVVQTAGFSGSAAKLKPVDLSALGAPGIYASIFDYGPTGGGIAYSTLLDSVYFYNEFVDATGGLAIVSLIQTKWNIGTLSQDTLRIAEYDVSAATTGFEKIALEFANGNQFKFGTEPDTLNISVVFFSQDASSVGNSYYSVDEFSLVNDATSAIAKNATKENVSVFPTVSNSVINFNFDNNNARTISIVDVTGKTVKTISTSAANNEVNVSDLTVGAYFYQVLNTNQQLVKAGKVVVSK